MACGVKDQHCWCRPAVEGLIVITYRLRPDTEARPFLSESDLPEYPSKRQLVEYAASEARRMGITYAEVLWIFKMADRRYNNIEAPNV